MQKQANIFDKLDSISSRKPENGETILNYFKSDTFVTFFSWKMFKVKLNNGKPIFDPSFDTTEANKYIEKEKAFLELVKKSGLDFAFIKLIADELPYYFWKARPTKVAKEFRIQVESYFKKVYPKSKVLFFSDFLKNPELKELYDRVFYKIYFSFDTKGKSKYVNPLEFQLEKKLRSTYYSASPLQEKNSIDLARKAFSLFAAESAILYKVNNKLFPNLVMLAGTRSVNTYKYEFYKAPWNRPTLPKLFVL